MYRALLDCAAFNVLNYLFPRSSVCGWYIIILGVQWYNCKQRSGIRTVSLTPFPLSTILVIYYLSPDIMKVAIDGFISEDAERSSIRIFLEVCGFRVTILSHFK